MDPWTTLIHITYVVHDGGPAFHGDALKDGEHSEADIVEADDAPLGSFPVRLALRYVARASEPASVGRRWRLGCSNRARCQLRFARQIPLAWAHSRVKK